jgi:hypothetical protein
MAKEMVLIGCRLPNGLILQHPKNRDIKVKLAGTYEAKSEEGLYMPPRLYTTTPVDAEFWAEWKAAYVGFPPLKNRAVFEARSDDEATQKAKDVKKEKTGFEGMDKNAVIDGVKMQKA